MNNEKKKVNKKLRNNIKILILVYSKICKIHQKIYFISNINT